MFEASGRIIEFPGYLRAYVEGSDDPESRAGRPRRGAPAVGGGRVARCRELEPKSHTTQPPNRYSEASLTRALEEMGIGRPSTYASIIDTILAREYVFKAKRGNVLVPTWTAFAVSQLLEAHLPNLVDYQFTAEMEDELDAISRGELSHLEYLNRFYFGNDHPGLKELLKNKVDEIDARDVSRVLDRQAGGAAGGLRPRRPLRPVPRTRRPPRAPSRADAARRADVGSRAGDARQGGPERRAAGPCPETGKPVFVKVGRFGPYVQRGTAEGDEKPQNASLLKGMKAEDVTLEVALKLSRCPARLGSIRTAASR